ncbi:MAG: hypothetical protein H0X51_09520 [Parachlamydiaceae bacterium]|nr:hypothetical protein [Parachlamydiaceae bacterium]
MISSLVSSYWPTLRGHLDVEACVNRNFAEQDNKSVVAVGGKLDVEGNLTKLKNASESLKPLRLFALITVPLVVTGAPVLFSATPVISFTYIAITSFVLATLETIEYARLRAIRGSGSATPHRQSYIAKAFAVACFTLSAISTVASTTTLATAVFSGLGLAAGCVVASFIKGKTSDIAVVIGFSSLFSTILVVCATSKIVFAAMAIASLLLLRATYVAKITQDEAVSHAGNDIISSMNLLWKQGLTEETFPLVRPLFDHCCLNHQIHRAGTTRLQLFLRDGKYHQLPEQVRTVFDKWRQEHKLELRTLILKTLLTQNSKLDATTFDRFVNDLTQAMSVSR